MRKKERKRARGWAETYPHITAYHHIPRLVLPLILPVELDGFEEGLNLTCLLLQEVWGS